MLNFNPQVFPLFGNKEGSPYRETALPAGGSDRDPGVR